mmetsp:Transcript_30785/g.55881  ORF Transcript_30785/g.55881 Transcript_30785/m.55881 type:complete len:302 (-) Transcript_30785:253-1158(-)
MNRAFAKGLPWPLRMSNIPLRIRAATGYHHLQVHFMSCVACPSRPEPTNAFCGMRLGVSRVSYKRLYAVAAGPQPAVSVITKRVDPIHNVEYLDWQTRINAAVSKQPGFLSVHKQGSDEDETTRVVVISFASQEYLDKWLASDERNRLLKESEQFHNVTSVEKIDTSAWGMVKAQPSPPVWKNAIVVFCALYPTITMTKIVVAPMLGMLEFWQALFPEVQGAVIVGITVAVMNTFSMKTAFSIIGPRFLPPDTFARTLGKVTVMLIGIGALVAAQIAEVRDAALTVFTPKDRCQTQKIATS